MIVIAPGQTSMVGAIKSLQNFDDTYLYVIRPVNARVLQQLRATRANVEEYQLLEQRRAGVQVAFGLMYVAIALTLLLSAIWIGMWFANRLVAPIRQLMGAAQEISGGNLAVKIDVNPADGDLAVLGSTFNTMTSELRSQRDELVGANTKLDERRRFMEAVLSGVTAGVVGVDADGVVTLVNRSAETLLEVKNLYRPTAGENGARIRRRAEARAETGQAPHHRPDHAQASWLGTEFRRARHQRGHDPGCAGLRRYLRRHDRAGQRATQHRLGRRRAAHRARDQESADADPALGRTHPPQIRRLHHQGSRGVRPMHRHHHPPGVGYRPHGRRVLRLRPHAEAGDGAARRARDRARSRVPVPGEPARDRLRARPSRPAGDGAFGPAAAHPGRHQSRQECERSH